MSELFYRDGGIIRAGQPATDRTASAITQTVRMLFFQCMTDAVHQQSMVSSIRQVEWYQPGMAIHAQVAVRQPDRRRAMVHQ